MDLQQLALAVAVAWIGLVVILELAVLVEAVEARVTHLQMIRHLALQILVVAAAETTLGHQVQADLAL